jgi:CcmD family protein
MSHMLPLMIVPLMVWVAVWIYLWTLGAKVKKLEAELARRETDDRGDGLGIGKSS